MNFFRRWLTSQQRHKVIVHVIPQPELDIIAERILMDMIRKDVDVDDYHFIVDTGWNIPKEGH